MLTCGPWVESHRELVLAKQDGPDGHMAVDGELVSNNTGRSFLASKPRISSSRP